MPGQYSIAVEKRNSVRRDSKERDMGPSLGHHNNGTVVTNNSGTSVTQISSSPGKSANYSSHKVNSPCLNNLILPLLSEVLNFFP
jgi:hypothetical protein